MGKMKYLTPKETWGEAMTHFFSKFLCKIGKHDWLYDSNKHTANRCCKRCKKWQHPVYDLSYGETYYVDGYYQYE